MCGLSGQSERWLSGRKRSPAKGVRVNSPSRVRIPLFIVGAGPCGLFQVFELGLLGLKAELVDSIRQPGGQCSELYPDKPIYDIPGIPVCTGDELTDSLLKQIEPFGAGMHLGDEVSVVRPEGDSFFVETDSGKQFTCKAVVIAAGVGSFQPRALRATGIDELDEGSIEYRVRNPEQYNGKELAILGGGDSALDWVVELAPTAKCIHLVHRRDEYRAVQATVDAMLEFVAAGKVVEHKDVKVDSVRNVNSKTQIVMFAKTDKAKSEPFEISVDNTLVFYGLAPKLGPIAEWGLDINRKTINVDTEKFETSTPGIYAIGDINHLPGQEEVNSLRLS